MRTTVTAHAHPDRAEARLAHVADLAGVQRNHDELNEANASWLTAAAADLGIQELVVDVSDALANICHALDRIGLDVDDVIGRALSAYEGDIAESERARRDAER